MTEKVTMKEIYEALGRNNKVALLVERYADQAREDARAEAGKWHDEYNALMKVTADLREQLDRVLVPRFKVGDRVTWGDYQADVTGIETSYALNIRGGNTRIFPLAAERIMESDLSLAPLETECRHETHRWLDPNGDGFLGRKVPNNNCPLCGESLTKKGEA
jgi:hypothetical protein